MMAFGKRKPPAADRSAKRPKEHSSKATGRGAKLLLGKSCAGCEFHDMSRLEKTGPDGQTLFMHVCTLPGAWTMFSLPSEAPKDKKAPAIILTDTPRIAPPQPSWCRLDRPEYEY